MRATSGTIHSKRKAKIFKKAKGFRAGRKRLYRTAKDAVMKAGNLEYVGRKLRKRDFRSLWIVRVNAACRLQGISYSQFIHGLKKANIELNRKSLSELAIHEPEAFNAIVSRAKTSLAA
ncbi:MAG: 50S ribosomal protein L20 [Leptospiraceae bacterium]|nr:50S ribosomal protein L20 [Leptospiraceae bacterium]